MEHALLTVSDLSIAFDKPVLNGLCMRVMRGQSIGLVGPSGSGKSLLAKAIMGLLPAQAKRSGCISMAGVPGNLLLQTETERASWRNKHIGFINQDAGSALNPALTCGRQMLEAVEVHFTSSRNEATAAAQESLIKAGIDDPDFVWRAYPHMLSGGTKQRVLIAMAICHNPALLIADEPTTALDTLTQMEVIQTLLDLKAQSGMAMLFISHDLDLVTCLADEVAVLHDGRIVEQYEAGMRPPKHTLLRAMPQRLQPPPPLPDRPTPLLSVRDLSVHYTVPSLFFSLRPHSLTAVESVSFDIYKGEMLGLVGASGSGKSSIAAALTNMATYQTGSILFEGRPIETLYRQGLGHRCLQMVFQNPLDALDPLLTVEELITAPMRFHRLHDTPAGRRRRAVELLEAVGLSADYLSRKPHQISGGQLQRVALARVLALKPQLIIFDESVSALDAHLRFTVIKLIQDLQAEFNFSGLFITHDLSLVRHVCHRIIVLEKGRIVESGPTEQISEAPQHPYTKSLLAAQPGRIKG